MKYEYNGNLLEEDRINLVANEIISKYPQISFDKAKEAAMLEGGISTGKNIQIEFNRLYNIMLVLKSDLENVIFVYNDLVNLIKDNKDDKNINYYYNITLEIKNFLMKKREFPYLDEF